MSSAGQGQGANQQINEDCLKALNYVYLHSKINVEDPTIEDIQISVSYKKIDKELLKKILLVFSSYLNNANFKQTFRPNRDSLTKDKCNNEEIKQLINQYIYNNTLNSSIDSLQILGNTDFFNSEEFINNVLTFYKTLKNNQIAPAGFSWQRELNQFIQNKFYELLFKQDSGIFLKEINNVNIQDKINAINIPPSILFFKQQENRQRILGEKLNAIGTRQTGAGGNYTELLGNIQKLINDLRQQGANNETVAQYFTRLDALSQQAGGFRQRLGDLGGQLEEYQILVAQISVKDQEIAALLNRLQPPTGQPQGASGGYISEEKVKKSHGRPVKNVATIKKTSLKKTYKNAIAV